MILPLVERFRCAWCDAVLSVSLRQVDLPAPPHWTLLDHHHVNPPLLPPGCYAVDEAERGRDRISGTYVLSPGDVRGTRFVHEFTQLSDRALRPSINLGFPTVHRPI